MASCAKEKRNYATASDSTDCRLCLFLSFFVYSSHQAFYLGRTSRYWKTSNRNFWAPMHPLENLSGDGSTRAQAIGRGWACLQRRCISHMQCVEIFLQTIQFSESDLSYDIPVQNRQKFLESRCLHQIHQKHVSMSRGGTTSNHNNTHSDYRHCRCFLRRPFFKSSRSSRYLLGRDRCPDRFNFMFLDD